MSTNQTAFDMVAVRAEMLAEMQPATLCDSAAFKIAARIVAELIATGDLCFTGNEAADLYAVMEQVAKTIEASLRIVDVTELSRV